MENLKKAVACSVVMQVEMGLEGGVGGTQNETKEHCK